MPNFLRKYYESPKLLELQVLRQVYGRQSGNQGRRCSPWKRLGDLQNPKRWVFVSERAAFNEDLIQKQFSSHV